MNDVVLFSEKQTFLNRWTWLLFILVNAFFIYGLIKQIAFDIPFGDKPASNGGLIAITVFVLMITSLFTIFSVKTEMKSDGIYVMFYPFHVKFKQYK
ncbi:MAG: hypothetical protein H7321_03230 [Bacteroidia bacterium]|nr:hypothetical protein [Bacteroidia bacterium]